MINIRYSVPWAVACLFSLGHFAAAQTVERGAAVVSEDTASQMPAFSFVEGPKFELNFRGSALVPAANGTAEVEYQAGRSRVSAAVRELVDPATLGPYTTYVLWAVTPQGQPSNLGVLEVRSGRGQLDAATALAQFGLMVTAEPHYAVTAPSKAIVLQNFSRESRLRATTIRTVAERIDYSTLPKQPADPRGRTPPDLVQARYALAIAQAVAAATYAPASYARAEALAKKAEAAQVSKKSSERRQTALLARDAVQALEAARHDAVAGRATSEEQAREAAQAEEARRRTAAAEEEGRRQTAAVAEQASQREAQLAEANRLAAEQAAAEARKREAATAAAAAAAGANEAAAKARAELLERLNKALPTTETERGLVAQISGVQFASGGAQLSAAAQNSLARFSGVLLSYPEIRFVVEGHTDNVGAEATNARLSQQRAITVRDFLIGQGLAASAIDVKGLGSSAPAADNATAAGRAANRRVEIVMSGGLLTR